MISSERVKKINFPYSEEGIIQCCWRWPVSWSCHFPGSGYHSDFHTWNMNTPWCHPGASTDHGQLVPPAEHCNIYSLDWGKINSHWKSKNLAEIRLYFTHRLISRKLQWAQEIQSIFKSLCQVQLLLLYYTFQSQKQSLLNLFGLNFTIAITSIYSFFSVWTIVSATGFVSTMYNVFGLKLAQHISWRIKYFLDIVVS